jgi:hypothetical protein
MMLRGHFCSQMEDECQLSSVDLIAAAVNEILEKISEEGASVLLSTTEYLAGEAM